jgi:hypothetical protein
MDTGKVIFEYVKDKHGHRRGVVCAVGKNELGWSLCNEKAGDKFDKVFALRIAIGRALAYPKYKRRVASSLRDITTSSEDVVLNVAPPGLKNNLLKMKDRAHRYFK